MALIRALVGVLHVGEPSLMQAIDSVDAQERVDSTLHLIGHLPKWDAHRALFNHFTSEGEAYDVMVKLDADMEILHPRLLAASGDLFARHQRVDHIVFGVDDWLSGERIMGMSIWRGGVRWEGPPPDLFTDLAPSSARGRLKLMDLDRPLVAHAQSPSETQALRYGAHRALKAARTGKASRLDRLEAFVHFTTTNPDPIRVLALAAAEAALLDPAFGRKMVDGLTTVTENDLSRLRGRAQHPHEIERSLLLQIERIRATRFPGAPPAPTPTGLLDRARGSLRRRLSPPPLDTQRLRAEFVASLDLTSG